MLFNILNGLEKNVITTIWQTFGFYLHVFKPHKPKIKS